MPRIYISIFSATWLVEIMQYCVMIKYTNHDARKYNHFTSARWCYSGHVEQEIKFYRVNLIGVSDIGWTLSGWQQNPVGVTTKSCRGDTILEFHRGVLGNRDSVWGGAWGVSGFEWLLYKAWGYYWILSGWQKWPKCLWGAPRPVGVQPRATPSNPDRGSDEGCIYGISWNVNFKFSVIESGGRKFTNITKLSTMYT